MLQDSFRRVGAGRLVVEDYETPDAADPQYQFVWSPRCIDAPVLRDENKDADGDCIDGNDERLYYTGDANMNVTALVNTSGNVVERYAYDPYGEVTVLDADWSADADGASDVANTVLFAGYRYDPETGLYLVRRRVYHPTLGRWVQRDPIGYGDGVSLYVYVQACPIAGADPLGLWKELDRKPTRAWATVCAEEGDSWTELAELLSLDATEYVKWAWEEDGKRVPAKPVAGTTYGIPNAVYLVAGKQESAGGSFIAKSREGDFKAQLMTFEADLEARGYFVSQRNDLLEVVTYKTTYAWIFSGHGALVLRRPDGLRQVEGRIWLADGRWVSAADVWNRQHHKFAWVQIHACYSYLGEWETTVVGQVGTAWGYGGEFKWGNRDKADYLFEAGTYLPPLGPWIPSGEWQECGIAE